MNYKYFQFLYVNFNLNTKKVDFSISTKKICDNCGAELSLNESVCPICGMDIRKEGNIGPSTCFHCGRIVSDLFICDCCYNFYCKDHLDPDDHDCKLKIESNQLQHEYNIAMHPELVQKNKPDFVMRGTIDGTYNWTPPELNKPTKKSSFKNNFLLQIKSYQGPLFLLSTILFFSLISLDFWNREYISLSAYGLSLRYYWIFITSLFIVSLNNLGDIIFLIIELVLMFLIINNLKQKTSVKLIYSIFSFSGIFSGIIFLFINAFFMLINLIYLFFFTVGLGGAGFLGLIAFSVSLEPEVEWNFYVNGIPIRLKGKNLLIFILFLRLIHTFLYGYFSFLTVILSFIDIFGILAGFIFFKCWKNSLSS